MKLRARSVSRVLIGLSFLWAAVQTSAQVVDPESVGLSADRLTRIQALMQRHIAANRFSGAVTLVARDNQIAWLQAQGVMDIESGRPMQTDGVFRIMSMTKPVVAFAILMMVEEGRVRLTDPASRFIPELAGLPVMAASTPSPVPASRDITVRDLLTHSSGLMSGAASSSVSIEFAPGDTLADLLPLLGDSVLEFEPGERWSYSPMFGFDVLARIVEVSSGVDFGTFVSTRIFEPLGMQDTYFYRDGAHPNVVKLYASEDGNLVAAPESRFSNGAYFSGGGGLFSTAEDYLQFALVLLNDGRLGGTRLLGRRTAELMHSVFLPESVPGRPDGEAYGLGVRVITDSAARATLLSEGSFGWSGAYNTHFFVDPEERVVGIYMTQVTGLGRGFRVTDDFETAVMQAIVD